jgi:hypothetical protein
MRSAAVAHGFEHLDLHVPVIFGFDQLFTDDVFGAS